MLLLIFMGLMAYCLIGSIYARRRYALQAHNRDSYTPSKEELEAVRIKAKSDLYHMGHGASCWQSSLKDRGCDCTSSRRYYRVKNQLAMAEKGVVPAMHVDNPKMVMLFWWNYMFNEFLTGGKVKKPNYARIAQLEAENILGLD